jgi:hypothetical protein
VDKAKQEFSWVWDIVEALLAVSAAQTLWRTAKVAGSTLMSPKKTWAQIRYVLSRWVAAL